jgi:hypothetical protein
MMISSGSADRAIHGGNYNNAIELPCLINFIYSIELQPGCFGFAAGGARRASAALTT